MRNILRTLGVMMALVLLGVSAGINAKFGFSLGRDRLDGAIFAAASVAADGFKAASVFFIAWAIASRQLAAAMAGIVLFIVCTGYSLTSAIGFAAVNRVELSEQRAILDRRYKSARRQLKDYRSQLTALGSARAKGEVEAAISAHKRHYRWQSTKSCTDVTAGQSRSYCAQYDALLGELARVRAAASMRRTVSDIENDIQSLEQKLVGANPNPQAEFLSRLFGMQIADMQLGLAMLLAVLVELGSGLGIFLSLHSGRTSEPPEIKIAGTGKDKSLQLNARPTTGDVYCFAIACITRADDGEMSFQNLYACYRAWCNAKGAIPIHPGIAEPEFAALLAASGVPVKRDSNGTAFVGIALEPTVERYKALPAA